MRSPFRAPRFISLQTRLLWGTVLVLLIVMATVIAVVEQRQRAAIIGEVQRRGEVIGRHLAAISTGPLLLYNFIAIEQNVVRVAREPDVLYAFILDAEGKVASHSRHPELVGRTLTGEADLRAVSSEELLVQELVVPRTGEPIYDITVPVKVDGQRWGTVRVGLSKRRMEAEIRRTRWELGGLTLATMALGGLGAALAARRIARPVRRLADGAAAIARGELHQQIEPSTSDEIGQLAIAFNHMASQLFQERAALEAANTELRRRFGELADLKSYTDSILGSITSGIVTLDLEGRVVTMNPVAELITGLFAPEAAGRYCTEVFGHTAEVAEILMETLVNRAGVANISLTLRRRNGTPLAVELSTAPLRGMEGKDLGVVGVFRDVTLVRELEAQLRRSDRLAALGTMAAGLAHEIKNPLASVRTFTRLVSRKFEDRRFRDTFEKVVPRELERINSIVEQLLQLARPARLSFEPVGLPALLERVLELYGNQIETAQITVVREYARDLPAVPADPEHLYQALVNLVGNALEAMDTGGRLTLRAAWSEDADGVPSGSRASSRRRVKLEVEDTGVGIPPSDANKVFTPFFTTKGGGTGLGLALAHKIVEDHGGAITFRSSPGLGTTFRILLPLVAEARVEVARDDRLRLP
ncbi:MAG TPA: ATP-binding protein [Methylomirabilota bacterium]|nr:ATP-binding protein [Methylomirabilota bacterium]